MSEELFNAIPENNINEIPDVVQQLFNGNSSYVSSSVHSRQDSCPLTKAAQWGKEKIVDLFLSGTRHSPDDAARAYEILEAASCLHRSTIRRHSTIDLYNNELNESSSSKYNAIYFRKAQQIRDINNLKRAASTQCGGQKLFITMQHIEDLEQNVDQGKIIDLVYVCYLVLKFYDLGALSYSVGNTFEGDLWPLHFARDTNEFFEVFFNFDMTFFPIQNCIENFFNRQRLDSMCWRQIIIYCHIMTRLASKDFNCDHFCDEIHTSKMPSEAASVLSYLILADLDDSSPVDVTAVVALLFRKSENLLITLSDCNDYVLRLLREMNIFRNESCENSYRKRHLSDNFPEHLRGSIPLYELVKSLPANKLRSDFQDKLVFYAPCLHILPQSLRKLYVERHRNVQVSRLVCMSAKQVVWNEKCYNLPKRLKFIVLMHR